METILLDIQNFVALALLGLELGTWLEMEMEMEWVVRSQAMLWIVLYNLEEFLYVLQDKKVERD
jgi:hypothetical protein